MNPAFTGVLYSAKPKHPENAYGVDAASRRLHETAWRGLPESAWQRYMVSGSFDSLSLLTSLALAQDGQG
jgi:hypothetical protein